MKLEKHSIVFNGKSDKVKYYVDGLRIKQSQIEAQTIEFWIKRKGDGSREIIK